MVVTLDDNAGDGDGGDDYGDVGLVVCGGNDQAPGAPFKISSKGKTGSTFLGLNDRAGGGGGGGD